MNVLSSKNGDFLVEVTEGVLVKITYDEIRKMAFLKMPNVNLRTTSPEGKIGHNLHLFAKAVERGVWSTGAPFNDQAAWDKLRKKLKGCDLMKLTDAGKVNLKFILKQGYKL